MKRAVEISVFDVIFLSETWLNDHFSHSEVKFNNYEIYRCDRDPVVSGRSRGGGVLIAVNSRLTSRGIPVASPLSSFDHVFVHLQVGNSSLLLGCVYIPPSSSLDTYVEHCSVVEGLVCRFPDSKIFIAGDYNLSDAVWSIDEEDSTMIVNCHDLSPAVQVCESFNSISLSQANSLPNDHGVFLDLLFTSESINTVPCSDPILSNSFHHNAFSFDISIPGSVEQLSPQMIIYDFAKCNLSELRKYLNSVDWSFISSLSDIEIITDRFYEFLLVGIEISTPSKRIFRSSFPAWFSKDLRTLVLKKKQAHRVYKRSKLESDYIRFSSLRSQCSYLNNKCYQEYLRRADNSLKSNPRYFWKFANVTRKTDGFPQFMYLNNETSSSGHETVNLFAKSFSTAYESSSVEAPDYPKLNCVDFNGCSFSSTEVFKALSCLPPKFSSGPDKVPSFILKKCASCLASPLSNLYNKSLLSGKYPSSWKSSFVFPIHKSGDRSNISNYRGVCIQSAIPKVLDKLISTKLSYASKHFISDRQHGFTAKRSTVTNLLCYQHDILTSFQNGMDVHSIYTDVAKAFDRVNTKFLIAKLRSYGLGDCFLRWLDNALDGRTQRVKIGDFISSSISVTSGVGQGSHSGPLWFSLFFNDLQDVIRHSSFQMFADDVKIYKSISNSDDCGLLQQDVDAFFHWLAFNGLQLTLSKCAFIYFSRRRQPIEYQYHIDSRPLNKVDHIKDLGILFDSKLSFSDHISNLSMRCHRMLGYVFRTSKGLSSASFKLLYVSLIRSLLEYACIVWSPCYIKYDHMLDRVQKRFLSCFHFRYPQCPISIEELKDRRLQSDSRFFEKLVTGAVDCGRLLSLVNLDCHRRLRGSNTFYVISCGTNYMYYTPLNRMMRAANSDIDFRF